jgi:hypothetical protein
MPFATFRPTEFTLDCHGVQLRVSVAEPDELGYVHCILTRDDYLNGPIVGIFAVHSSLAHMLPADLPKYAQRVVDGLERPSVA